MQVIIGAHLFVFYNGRILRSKHKTGYDPDQTIVKSWPALLLTLYGIHDSVLNFKHYIHMLTCSVLNITIQRHMSCNMRFTTTWCVQPAKAQIWRCIRAILIRAFASREKHLEFHSLKLKEAGLSESSCFKCHIVENHKLQFIPRWQSCSFAQQGIK